MGSREVNIPSCFLSVGGRVGKGVGVSPILQTLSSRFAAVAATSAMNNNFDVNSKGMENGRFITV